MRSRMLLFVLLAGCQPGTLAGTLSDDELVSESDVGGAHQVESQVLGVRLTHPPGWQVAREKWLVHGGWGFTLWSPPADGDVTPHAQRPLLRVARPGDLRPDEIDARIAERRETYAALSPTVEEVTVGGRQGRAVGPIPGSTPYVEVYLPVDDRVYELDVYGLQLDDDARARLATIAFSTPSREVASLALPEATDATTWVSTGDPARLDQELMLRSTAVHPYSTFVPYSPEAQIAEGCWRADSAVYVQTQQGPLANQRWGAKYTGYTLIGRPNFWGHYTHGDLGYGRCVVPYYTNDYYAIDYPLDVGDTVYSPFAGGTVTFAGRNTTHADYGILVTIQADNGKYVSLAGHLSALARGIHRGARVDADTIIGYAGATGGSIPVGESHLHQAFYRNPSFNPDGAPYGGQGLQVIYHHYLGTGTGLDPGVYKYGWKSDRTTWSALDYVSN